MYRVIKPFLDFQDPEYHEYAAGDVYPRKGVQTSDDRVKMLSGKDNLQHTPLIAEEVQKKGSRKKTTKTEA